MRYAGVSPRSALHAGSGSAEGDRRHRRVGHGGRALYDAARRDRHRQDDDDGRRHPGGPAALAGDRPQQDACGAAVQRVPDVLPGQRRRVLRQLLRLLPARGLRPVEGPLHREGLGDQRRDRSPAPRGDGGAVRSSRRDHRRQRVGDLRPRLAGDLRAQHADPQARRHRRPRCAAAQARLDAVLAQRRRARARPLPRPRRGAGDLPGLRRVGLPRDDVRRRGRAALALRPADRASCSRTTSSTSRSGRRRTTRSRTAASSARSRRSAPSSRRAAPSSRPRASCSSRTACASAPSTTWRCCARWASATASRTTRGSSTAARPGARPYCLLDYYPDGLRLLHRRVPSERAADRRHVRGRPLAQADARRLRLPPAERARQPPADVRRVPVDHAADGVRVSDAGRVRAAPLEDDRRADRSTDRRRRAGRHRCARRATRSTT